jgi:uncharacterized protein (TIGR03083 family)
MEHSQFIAAIRREGDDCTRAAREAGLDAKVPSCGDWTVADLCEHLGKIHRWVRDVVVHRPEPRSWDAVEIPARDALLDFLGAGYEEMAAALESVPPSEEMWSWTDDHTAGFWARRQAQELAVHRWDAQLAAGFTEPIDRELAVDGIQEVFDMMPYRTSGRTASGNGETIHLHCTDGEGEWLIRHTADGVEVTREHAKGDVAARGSASDLLLMLWGRIPPEQLEVFGNVELLARFDNARL